MRAGRPERLSLALASIVLTVACGRSGPAPEGEAAAPRQEPTATNSGMPGGSAVTGSIGPSGGSLKSSDGRLTLNVPTGALAGATEITVQAVTQPAPTGLGNAYRLTPSGLQFKSPIDLVFQVSADDLARTTPEALEVAVQDDAGKWALIKAKTVDVPRRTVTARTTHFSVFAVVAGLLIIPDRATLPPGGQLQFRVMYCPFIEAADFDFFLREPCDPSRAPIGSFTDWTVNGVRGGNAAVGTVSPADGIGTNFTAPAAVPARNPVAVSVNALYGGRRALLVSNVTITSADWSGQTISQIPTGRLIVRDLGWTFDKTEARQQFFKPSGTIEQTEMVIAGCQVVSYAPRTYRIGPDDGNLAIDFTTDPPSVTGGGATYWEASVCVLCPGAKKPGCTEGATAGGAWFGLFSPETLKNNGTTIEGTADVPFSGSFTFTFKKRR